MIIDSYGYEYNRIKDFVAETTNNFTVKELNDALSNGEDEPLLLDYIYKKRKDVDDRGYSLTECYKDNKELKKYLGLRYTPRDGMKPIGYRLCPTYDFYDEGGTLNGFGTFNTIDSGHLGDGHESWSLIKHLESGRLFLLQGFYSSWGDSGWNDDGYIEVEPAKVTVLRYKPLGADDSKAFDNPATTVR